MSTVDTKTVGKAFRSDLQRANVSDNNITKILTVLAQFNNAGATIEILSIVVHNIVKDTAFRTKFLSNPRGAIKSIPGCENLK